jgi:general secretion pathway protein A
MNMNDQFFNFLGLREDPFHVSPDPRFYYSTPAHEAALVELLFGIETRQGFLVLTGEAGTGKTSLLNQILNWLHRRGRSTAYIFHTHLEPIGLLRFILSDFGLPCQSKSKSELVKTLHGWLVQRNAADDLPVLILDEAQAIPTHTLDELRLLLNLETPRGKLLQIILSGQPELDEKLRLPQLRQLRQRIMFHSRLSLLTPQETAAYISNRLAVAGCPDSSLFPDQVIQDIYRSSRGIPRVVNLLCEHALISACSERQRAVSPDMIRRIALDFDLLAKPLAVDDSEPQTDYAGFAKFPVMEERVPRSTSSKRLTACGWEQIDFELFKEPYTGIHEQGKLARPEEPVPAPSASVAEAAEPVAHSVDAAVHASTASQVVERRGHWRRRGRVSKLAAFARSAAAPTRHAWQEVSGSLISYADDLRRAVASASTKRRQPSPEAQVAVKERRLAAVHSPTPAEPTKRWRRPRSAATVFARNHVASVEAGWHAVFDPASDYVRSVGRSFVRDCSNLFRGLTPATPAMEVGSSPGDANRKRAARSVLAPLVSWLRQPITPSNIFSNRSSSGSNHRK